MSSHTYEQKYAEFSDNLAFVTMALEEDAGHTVEVVARKGREATAALFDAVIDHGHRRVLVSALNAPSISGAVREQIETMLYGCGRQSKAALFTKPIRVVH